LLDGGKIEKRTLRVGSGNEKRRKMMRGGKKRVMNNIRSLKKKIAYAPNLGPSRKDD
jgi:hypothetical protein